MNTEIPVTAYIALGSNKGNRQENLKKAVELIESDENCRVISKSFVYETKPFGYLEQNNFLNAVVSVETDFELKEFFHFLKETEKKLGRTKNEKWGPREIDLDLLFYDELIYSDAELKVPHTGITERDFVIVPFCDISPDFIHPEKKLKISQIDLNKLEKNIISKSEHKL